MESAVIIFILSLSRKRLLIRENTFPCHMEKVIDDVFSTVLMVRPGHAESSEKSRKQHFDKIRVEITKEFWQEFCEKEHPQDTVWLHVNPADVMVLK